MSLPVSITGASTTNPQRPERRKSRAPRRLPATEAQQHDIVHDIVLETAVNVAPDPARDQVPVDGLPTAAVIDQMWQANPLQTAPREPPPVPQLPRRQPPQPAPVRVGIPITRCITPPRTN